MASGDDGRDGEIPIPIQAVNALMSALGYRDITTAEHCRQVAELCVMTAERMMSPSECFVLEVAGLLHDIGKLGVPDSILLKPGTLSDEEWEVMRRYSRMGVAIISSAFGSEELTELVRNHRAWFDGNPREAGLPRGKDIPLPARIGCIADAFSAMVSDRPYRQTMSVASAFAELRRCAGTQFDPELVERFIARVNERGDGQRTASEVRERDSLDSVDVRG